MATANAPAPPHAAGAPPQRRACVAARGDLASTVAAPVARPYPLPPVVVSEPTVSVVVPVYNKVAFVRPSIDSIVAAANAHGAVEIVAVDHGSTDGSYEALLEYADAGVRVLRHSGGTISTLRNVGARATRGRVLSFIDSDVVVPRDFFTELEMVLAETGAAAAGCEYDIPAAPHWTEKAWYELHVIREDGYRHYLNGGDLAIRRGAFDEIGGFAEDMAVGEDTEICKRLRAAGHRIFESQRLRVVHLGNPKSVRAFFAKQVWHGTSVLRSRPFANPDKPTLMLFAHAVAVVAAVAVILAPSPLPMWARLALAAAFVLAAPVASVLYRFVETRRVTNPVAATALYAVFYAARATALTKALVAAARARRAAADDAAAAARTSSP
ncbi:MAG TPA: glycosyltransferase [Gemmatimonadaceae bacterium]|nr:glycosyltransferase [Gemmatimonadaceae bacterium]